MKVYAARFAFDAKTGLKQLVIATQRWLADVRRFGRGIGDMDLLTPWQGKAEGRDGCHVTIDTFEAGGTRLWACRFSHADRDYADRRWTTHIGARLTEQSGVCSVFLDLESTGSTVTMQRFTTSRPQIVVDLLEAIGEESRRSFGHDHASRLLSDVVRWQLPSYWHGSWVGDGETVLDYGPGVCCDQLASIFAGK